MKLFKFFTDNNSFYRMFPSEDHAEILARKYPGGITRYEDVTEQEVQKHLHLTLELFEKALEKNKNLNDFDRKLFKKYITYVYEHVDYFGNEIEIRLIKYKCGSTTCHVQYEIKPCKAEGYESAWYSSCSSAEYIYLSPVRTAAPDVAHKCLDMGIDRCIVFFLHSVIMHAMDVGIETFHTNSQIVTGL